MKTRSWLTILGLIVLALLIVMSDAALAVASPNRPGPAGNSDLAVAVVPVAFGFTEPVGIVFTGAPGDTRMFIVERAGVIKIVEQDGHTLPIPFLNIAYKVNTGGSSEKGLVGLAFDPNYAANGRFYVYYTTPNFPITNHYEIHLARFNVSADPDVASPTETILLTIPHPDSQIHNGGELQFGRDGYLYLGPGDGGGGGDPGNHAQNKDKLLGKILRIDVSGVPTYAIPASNPFTQTVGARAEIWAYGLRNPWRFSFDTATGDLYIGDVGQNTWEEVDFQAAHSGGGQNYGWNCFEGNHLYLPTPPDCPLAPPLVTPVAEHDHSQGDEAIVGGYVDRGSLSPPINGYYVFADYISGRFWAMRPGSWQVSNVGVLVHNPSTLGQDPAGELYAASFSDGNIYRLVALPVRAYLPLLIRH
jgi:glucose/arabinose dehydrogenase